MSGADNEQAAAAREEAAAVTRDELESLKTDLDKILKRVEAADNGDQNLNHRIMLMIEILIGAASGLLASEIAICA